MNVKMATWPLRVLTMSCAVMATVSCSDLVLIKTFEFGDILGFRENRIVALAVPLDDAHDDGVQRYVIDTYWERRIEWWPPALRGLEPVAMDLRAGFVPRLVAHALTDADAPRVRWDEVITMRAAHWRVNVDVAGRALAIARSQPIAATFRRTDSCCEAACEYEFDGSGSSARSVLDISLDASEIEAPAPFADLAAYGSARVVIGLAVTIEGLPAEVPTVVAVDLASRGIGLTAVAAGLVP